MKGIDINARYLVKIEGSNSVMRGDELLLTIRDFINISVIMDSGSSIVFIHYWTYYNEYDRDLTIITYSKI